MTVNSVTLETVHHIRDTCLCFAAQQAARRLARRFDKAFLAEGITNQQFSLMMALSGPKPPKLTQLAPFLGMDRTTLTAALAKLERRGLARSTPDETDKRTRRSVLTEEGRAVLARAAPIWKREHAALESELAGIDAKALRHSLTAIR